MLERKHLLNTLALAGKQLDLAQKLDRDAVLEISNDEGAFRYTLNELKAEALLLEGITHQLYDLRRALPALVAATQAQPTTRRAFYVLGLAHAANLHKADAVAALEKAVALDPKNLSYRKELNRAESLTGAEIAAYRATRAGERIVDTAATTWNIFAIVWNIVTFPLRVVVAIFRALRLIPSPDGAAANLGARGVRRRALCFLAALAAAPGARWLRRAAAAARRAAARGLGDVAAVGRQTRRPTSMRRSSRPPLLAPHQAVAGRRCYRCSARARHRAGAAKRQRLRLPGDRSQPLADRAGIAHVTDRLIEVQTRIEHDARIHDLFSEGLCDLLTTLFDELPAAAFAETPPLSPCRSTPSSTPPSWWAGFCTFLAGPGAGHAGRDRRPALSAHAPAARGTTCSPSRA